MGKTSPAPSSGSIAAGTCQPWGADGANPTTAMPTDSIYPIAKRQGENSQRTRNSIGKEKQRGGDGTSNNPMTFMSSSQAHVSPGTPGWGPSRPWVNDESWTSSFPQQPQHAGMLTEIGFFLNLSLFCWTSRRATKHCPLALPPQICGKTTTGN